MRAARTVRRAFWAASAFGALLLSGCGGKSELIEFNERLVRSFRKLERATKEFVAAGGAFVAGKDPVGKPVSLSEFHTRYDRLKRVVEEARAEAAALQVPPVSGARKYYESFQHFLEVSEQTVADCQTVRNLSEKEALAGRQRLFALLNRASVRTRAAWDRMVLAQQAFAKENEIKLK
jgi:hypothetical protein